MIKFKKGKKVEVNLIRGNQLEVGKLYRIVKSDYCVSINVGDYAMKMIDGFSSKTFNEEIGYEDVICYFGKEGPYYFTYNPNVYFELAPSSHIIEISND